MIDISGKNRDSELRGRSEGRRVIHHRSLEAVVVAGLVPLALSSSSGGGSSSTGTSVRRGRTWKGLELGGRADEPRLDLLAQLGLVPEKLGMGKDLSLCGMGGIL